MPVRYSACIGASAIAADVSYDELVGGVLEFVLRAAIAVAADQFEWEHEELRRDGLTAIEFFREGKALWWDRECFESERADPERNATASTMHCKSANRKGLSRRGVGRSRSP